LFMLFSSEMSIQSPISLLFPYTTLFRSYNPELVQEVPAKMFQGVDNIQPGMQFQAQTDDGVQIVTVKAVEGENVLVDANFPLAGDRKSTRLNSSHVKISYAVFCLKKKNK